MELLRLTLLCSCGKEMKIIKIVIDPIQIWCILKNIGWSTTAPDFDVPQNLTKWEICQLIPGKDDGFPDDWVPCILALAPKNARDSINLFV
jgi:hypothetical protein